MAKKFSEKSVEILNRKASHRYFILEEFEAGIVLQGTEVKAFRDGLAQISEAFVRLDANGQLWLLNAHISEYRYGTDANHEPARPRKLLLHQKEIQQVRNGLERQGMTAVPLKMYLSHGLVKLKFALCKGKELHDKREALKRAMAKREAERAMSFRHR